MTVGTTPTYILTLPTGTDLDDASEVIVTFATTAHSKIIEKKKSELAIEDNVITVWISQQESLLFPVGQIEIQVNWTYTSGAVTDRACSEIAVVQSHRNLHNEVI